MMASGFFAAASALDDANFYERGLKCLNFIKTHLYDPTTGSLLRCCYLGENREIEQMYNLTYT